MGMPQIIIRFKAAGGTAIRRSARGQVVLLLEGDSHQRLSFSRLEQVSAAEVGESAFRLLELCFLGRPAKVHLVTYSAGEAEEIRAFFSSAKNYRDSLAVRTSKTATVHELYSELSDREGQIAKVTSLLADAHINLRNIGILHNREYEQGVLRIEFADAEALHRAHRCLTQAGYTIYRR